MDTAYFSTKDLDCLFAGKNGLLNAPTGSGKTYALWMPVVLDYIKKILNIRPVMFPV